ncbi:EpsG family protein [Pseudomonas sp. NPDC089743]|uniref:EpsG family protein n=1 Tax=Pseudomonas sp. NPDC089743 TaxID=3364471 RepID=UPI0037F35B03
MIYTFFYVLIRLISFGRLNSGGWLVLLSFMLIVLAAIRSPEVSDDYYNYINYYSLMISVDKFSFGLPVEPGFYFLAKASEVLTGSHLMLFIAFAALGVGIKSYVFKNYAEFSLVSLLIYFSFYYFQFEFAHIRVGVAVGILYLCFFLSLERANSIWIIAGVALAMLFHYSSLCFLVSLVAYWLANSRYSYLAILSYLILSAALIVCFYLGIGAKDAIRLISNLDFTGKLNYYLEVLDDGVLTRINVFNRLGMHVIAYLLMISGYKRIKNLGHIALVHLHGFGILFFCMFAQIPVVAYRISDIFLFSSVFTVPLLAHVRPQILTKSFIFAFSLIYFVVMVFFSGNEVYYKTIF